MFKKHFLLSSGGFFQQGCIILFKSDSKDISLSNKCSLDHKIIFFFFFLTLTNVLFQTFLTGSVKLFHMLANMQ